ncbi:hypothetical protein KCP78_05510 [Salmonella enterica subsp. enterica]|nr:hypothetical protein KCP78_05510 [Salmonella enterica subsp. enterica]
MPKSFALRLQNQIVFIGSRNGIQNIAKIRHIPSVLRLTAHSLCPAALLPDSRMCAAAAGVNVSLPGKSSGLETCLKMQFHRVHRVLNHGI